MSESEFEIDENRPYDLESLTPGEPSIHILPNEIMLHVFSFLSINAVTELEIVCRRWRHFSIEYYRDQVKHRNGIVCCDIRPHSYYCPSLDDKFCDAAKKYNKILKCAGDLVETINFIKYQRKITNKDFSYICEKCPNLKGIDLTEQSFYVEDFRVFVNKCIHLEALSISLGHFTYDHDIYIRQIYKMMTILSSLRLKYLKLCNFKGFCAEFFDLLPVSLETITCLSDNDEASVLKRRLPSSVYQNLHLQKLPLQCRNLTNLQIHFDLSSKQIKEVGSNFPKLEHFSFCSDSKIDLMNFPNLKQLLVTGRDYSIDLRNPLFNLEIIKLYGRLHESSCALDFGLLKNVKEIVIRLQLNRCTTLSIAKCINLQRLCFEEEEVFKNYRILNLVNLTDILEIIHNCPKLQELKIPSVEMTSEYIPKFVQAMKNRDFENKLYLRVGMKWETRKEAYKLEAANYVLDVNDLDEDSNYEYEHNYDAHAYYNDDDNNSYCGNDFINGTFYDLDYYDADEGIQFDRD